ncbi:anoctamin-4-like isoform X2 [Phymastichus coffea]|uniref:anoctamin-4-like isoform X2 n=1 Tax=Phymastichus coffea TaxID=108790 RepID=UPI00273BF3B4|nr:anoctamin-4-like isoform X2 [Phymastichus coffea]
MDIFGNANGSKVDNDVPLELSQRIITIEQDNFPIQSDINISYQEYQNVSDDVDFVLAYVENGNATNAQKRELFERSLLEQGLQLEYEENRHLCFVKIYASKEVLCRYCEIMKLRMPIKPLPDEKIIEETDFLDDAKSWFVQLFSFAQLDADKFPPTEYKLSAEYARDKDYLFDTEDKNFFPTHIRVMIVDFILERQCEGIQQLLAAGVYSAAYPLHDGTTKQKGSVRALLLEEWGNAKMWIKVQPLDTIREYFGINFAMYFAWLGFYTYMLIPASIAGIITFFYGLITIKSNRLADDTCSNWAKNTIMCPQCDKTCDFWRLSETCLLTRITYLFDNPAIVYFAVFISVWSVFYLELWKRRAAELSYRWGLGQWDRTADHSRPQYLSTLANIKIFRVKEKINPVTGEKEPHVSFWKVRVPATFFSFSVVLLLTALALAAVFAVVLYRMASITSTSLFGHDIGYNISQSNYKTFAIPAIAAGINLVCILVLNFIYDWLAVYLTEMELLRTQSEFDDSLTLKVYLFQFINYYASIFYIAFLKGKFVGYPMKYNKILGFRQEECSPGGCLLELSIQLTIIMIGVRGLYDEYLEMVIQFGFITLFVVAFPLAPLFALANNVFEMRLDASKFLRHYRRPVPRRARDIGIWGRILEALARISITTNGFIIAFSSTFIPRLVYMAVVSPDKTDVGFLNHSLAVFNTKDFANNTEPLNSSFENVTTCRYAEYRNPPDHFELPYKRPSIYWHILAVRLAFVVVFQNAVGLINMAVQWSLSGNPRKLRDQMKRETYLTEELIIKREAERARDNMDWEDKQSSVSPNSSIKKRKSYIRETEVSDT